MKIRIVLSDRSWRYKLRVRLDDKARYYAQLVNQSGEPLPRGPIIGGFSSLDWVVAQAPRIYAELLVRAEATSGRNAAPDHSSIPTTKPDAPKATETNTTAASAAAPAGA